MQWPPRQAATTRSMPPGNGTRRDFGPRQRPTSTGSSRPRGSSIPQPASTDGGSSARRVQYLPQRRRPACRVGPRRAAGDQLRQPRHGHETRHHLRAIARRGRGARALSSQDLGVKARDRVIIYMPMIPEAVIAMLACARIGAIHSVVFGGFAAKELATRIDDAKPKVVMTASCGIEGARVVPYKPLLDEAMSLATAKPEACLVFSASAGGCLARRRARPRLGRSGRRGARRWARQRVPAASRDRSSLRALHVGHDRQAEGRRARQRRPHGRAQMVDEEHLWRRTRRGVLGRIRRRLGRRPFLHRLRTAFARMHDDPLRGKAGRHARCGRVLAGHRRTRRLDALHRADGVPRDQEGGSGRRATSSATTCPASGRSVPCRRAG